MELKKLAPWNWFKKEEESESAVPVLHTGQLNPEEDRNLSNPIAQLQKEMDRLFDTTFRRLRLPTLGSKIATPLASGRLLKPQVDVASTNKEYSITVEIPGVNQDDVKVEISDNTMTIHGEKKKEREEKEKNYYCIERSYGSFRRILSLPLDADQDNVNATFKNGILKIRIGRKAQPDSSVKQIDVR